MKHIYGKNVFLTGGSSGIGLATAELLAKNGYIVYAGSRRPGAEIRQFAGGGEIRPITLDVSDEASVAAAAKAVLAAADIGVLSILRVWGLLAPPKTSPLRQPG